MELAERPFREWRYRKPRLTIQIASVAGLLLLNSAATAKESSPACHAWQGTYTGEVTERQTFSGSTRKVGIWVQGNEAQIDFSGEFNPHIEITSDFVLCTQSHLSGKFSDNFSTSGRFSIQMVNRITYFTITVSRIGDLINDSGYYPQSSIVIVRE